MVDTRSIDVTVVLNTGPRGLGSGLHALAEDSAIPMWRVDDGPVFGVPFWMCERARRHSQQAEARGFPASMPSDECANVTHLGPFKTYSQVVNLPEGVSTISLASGLHSSQDASDMLAGAHALDGPADGLPLRAFYIGMVSS